MLKTYSAKEVVIALGSHIVTGTADDSFITIEPNGDGMMKKTGCHGEVVRAISPDGTYKVKLSLLQTAPTNGWLQEQYDRDRETGEALFPILIKDLKGGMIFSAQDAWVVKPPSRGYGKDTNNREWELDTGDSTLTEDSSL